MVQRVLIKGGDTSAMKVSFPGFDVTTANLDQLCFDGRWSGLTPYLHGTIDTANGGANTVSFGETLSSPPLFVGQATIINPATGLPTTAYGNTPFMLRGNGIDQWFYVNVTVNALAWNVNGFPSQVVRLTYTLFKRPAG